MKCTYPFCWKLWGDLKHLMEWWHQTVDQPRVGKYFADYSSLTDKELRQPTGAEDLVARSRKK